MKTTYEILGYETKAAFKKNKSSWTHNGFTTKQKAIDSVNILLEGDEQGDSQVYVVKSSDNKFSQVFFKD